MREINIFEMTQPLFIDKMHPDYLQEQRKNKALRVEISVGGKIFCWHDYTFICRTTPRDVGDMIRGINYRNLCVKCGKEKRTNYLILENLIRQ